LREHGALDEGAVGGHIHLSLRQFGTDVRVHQALLQLFDAYEDVLFRLGMNPRTAAHRGEESARPMPQLPARGFTRVSDIYRVLQGGRQGGVSRNFAMNFEHVSGSPDDHIEFRFPDADVHGKEFEVRLEVLQGILDEALRVARDPEWRPPAPRKAGYHAGVRQRVRYAGGPGGVTVFEPDEAEHSARFLEMLNAIFRKRA